MRRLVPVFALAVAIVAVVADPSSAVDSSSRRSRSRRSRMGLRAGRPARWAVPSRCSCLWWPPSARRSSSRSCSTCRARFRGRALVRRSRAAGLGLLAALHPWPRLVQDPAEISVGIWILGIVFPWAIARGVLRQEARGRTRRYPAGARPAGAARRTAADRPRRPRPRRTRAGRRHAPGHERPPRAAPRPRGRRGGAALGRGGRAGAT